MSTLDSLYLRRRFPTKIIGHSPFVEAILEADRRAPRKRRHTAHRIWKRVRRELSGESVGESTVREYVRQRKVALGLVRQGTLVPQSYAAGGCVLRVSVVEFRAK